MSTADALSYGWVAAEPIARFVMTIAVFLVGMTILGEIRR